MEKQMAKKSIRCPQCTLSYPKREVRCPHCGQHPDQPVTPPESLVVREPQLGAAETVVLARTDAPPEPERAEATDQPNRHYGEGMARWQIAWDITKATAGLIKLGMWDIPWMAYDKVQVYRERRREVATPTPPDRVHDDEPAAPAPADRSAREDRPRRERPASSERRPASSADRPATSETRAPRTNERTNPVAAPSSPAGPSLATKIWKWIWRGLATIVSLFLAAVVIGVIIQGAFWVMSGGSTLTPDRSISLNPFWVATRGMSEIQKFRFPEIDSTTNEPTQAEQDAEIRAEGHTLIALKTTPMKKGPASYASDVVSVPAGSLVVVTGEQNTGIPGETWIPVVYVDGDKSHNGWISQADLGTMP